MDDDAWTIPTRQKRRIVRAAQYWLAGHPSYAGHDIAFDVVLAAPWAWPAISPTPSRFDVHFPLARLCL